MEFTLSVILRVSVLLLTAAIACLAAHRRTAALRHAIWSVAMIAALLVPLAAMVAPRIHIWLPAEAPIVVETPSASTARVQDLAPSTEATAIRTPIQNNPTSVQRTPEPANWNWRPAAFVIWATIAIGIFFRYALGVFLFNRMTSHSSGPAELRTNALLEALKSRLAITRPVHVRVGTNGLPPMTGRIFRPIILLPIESREWTDERLRFVLTHELAHVRRRDGVMQCIARLSCAIHWFNPLIWFASKQLDLERERACDDLVLANGESADAYASHLLAIARAMNANSLLTGSALPMAQHSQLQSRLLSIIRRDVNHAPLSLRALTCLLTCGLIATSGVITLEPMAWPAPLRLEAMIPAAIMIPPTAAERPSVVPALAKSRTVLAPPFAAEFVRISAGTFVMGCRANEGCSDVDAPPHEVRLTHPFEIGKFEVTQQQWDSVMETNPSDFRGPDLPVEQISWNDIQSFLNYLNTRGDGFHYRLPTEAEWEYATRAGAPVHWLSGPRIPPITGWDPLADIAWTGRNSEGHTHPVGQKQANAWGLYDTFGNVAELTSDLYRDGYEATAVSIDPQGPSAGFGHVVRGNSWDLPFAPRFRYDAGADARYDFIGFRLVREPQAVQPTFEAASIKPSDPNGALRGGRCIGIDAVYGPNMPAAPALGTCRYLRATLSTLLSVAYVGLRTDVLVDVKSPEWATLSEFDVLAKSPNPAATTTEDLRRMLQQLLAERFKVQVRHDTKEVNGFALIVGRNSARLKAPVQTAPDNRNMHIPDMQNLISVISRVLKAPVIDMTGISGAHDFSLHFAEGSTRFGDPLVDPDATSIFTAVAEQLGLQLKTQKVAVDTIVLEHAEKTTPN